MISTIAELEKPKFDRARAVFEPLDYHLGVRAIIDGYVPGRIWVDDADKCETALMWDTRYSYYLSGCEDNPEFNQAFDQLFSDITLPEAKKKNINMYFVICQLNWERKLLNNELLVDRFPKRIKRCYYAFKQKVVTGWEDAVPSGFAIERVDESLLKRTDLQNIDALIGEIEDIIASVGEFLGRKFAGFCLVHGDKEIASWCLSFMYGSSCEFTVQTVEEYQQRGFGTLTTAALIDYCFSRDFTSIGWHCGQENVPSMKLAEKVGFKRTNHSYSWIYGNLPD